MERRPVDVQRGPAARWPTRSSFVLHVVVTRNGETQPVNGDDRLLSVAGPGRLLPQEAGAQRRPQVTQSSSTRLPPPPPPPTSPIAVG